MSATRLPALTLAVLLTAVLAVPASAQFVERPKLVVQPPGDGFGFGSDEERLGLPEGQSALQLLENASLDVNAAVAKANLTALSYYAKVGQNYYPFYVFTSFPVLTPDRQQLQEYLANEILNQFGGLLNLTVARRWHFLHDGRPGQEGFSFNVVGGGKVLEVVGLTENEYTPAAHFGTDAEMRIWLTNQPDAQSLAGLIHLRGSLLANYVGSDSYTGLFEVDGPVPTKLPVTLSFSGSIHIFDQLYLSGGYVTSTEDRLPDRKFVSLSVNRR